MDIVHYLFTRIKGLYYVKRPGKGSTEYLTRSIHTCIPYWRTSPFTLRPEVQAPRCSPSTHHPVCICAWDCPDPGAEHCTWLWGLHRPTSQASQSLWTAFLPYISSHPLRMMKDDLDLEFMILSYSSDNRMHICYFLPMKKGRLGQLHCTT